jgi:very-short-patch-repair endonuclease
MDYKSLKPKKMKPLRWCTKSEDHKYMQMRQQQNLERCVTSANENWMAEKLKATGLKWRRQAQWGMRLYDFWCHHLGVAVEVDGPEHDQEYDRYRDEYNLRRSGIIVLRVRNMNEEDAELALTAIAGACNWKARRDAMGLNVSSKKARRRLVT